MAKRVVVWTKTAAKQRRAVLTYWALRNKSTKYSKKLIQLINQRVSLIAKNPELFKATSFPDTRESAMGHFSLYYKVIDSRLVITAFWDNRQDPKELLKNLGE